MQVAGHVLGLSHVRQDELPHVVVALAASHELADRDPQALLEHVARTRADAVPADVGVVDRRAEEGNDTARTPRGHEHGDVEQLPGRLVRVVRDEDVARLDAFERILLEHRTGRDRQRVDVPRGPGDRLRDHAPAAVEQGVREVAGLANDRAERRALERPCLLVDRADEALPQDLELNGVHQLPPVCAASRIAITEPSSFTVAVQPGRSTAVVSRSSRSAGPTTRAPGPSARRSYTGVGTGSR